MSAGRHLTCFAEGRANHVSRCGAMVEHPAPGAPGRRLNPTDHPRDGHPSEDCSQDARSLAATAVQTEEKPKISEAGAAYRLGPTDAVGKHHAATLGPNVNQGHLRVYSRSRGIPGKLWIRKGLRPTACTQYRVPLGIHLRVVDLVGEKLRDRLPVPAVSRGPTSPVYPTRGEIFPQHRSGGERQPEAQ